MTIAEAIRIKIRRRPKGKPFMGSGFHKLGTRSTVNKVLSRLVKEGEIERVYRGVYMRPKHNRYIGAVMPGVSTVAQLIAKSRGEIIEVHGAEAARRFRLSTQMPVIAVFYTSGPSRWVRIGKGKVKMMHTGSKRRLQFAGSVMGLALSALWYLGKEETTPKTIAKIKARMSPENFETLKSADVPAWMSAALNNPELPPEFTSVKN